MSVTKQKRKFLIMYFTQLLKFYSKFDIDNIQIVILVIE